MRIGPKDRLLSAWPDLKAWGVLALIYAVWIYLKAAPVGSTVDGQVDRTAFWGTANWDWIWLPLIMVASVGLAGLTKLDDLTVREKRRPDLVVWRTCWIVPIDAAARLLLVALFVADLRATITWVWTVRDWPRAAIAVGIGALMLRVVWNAVRDLADRRIIAAIDRTGLTHPGGRLAWSSVRGAVLDLAVRPNSVGFLPDGVDTAETWIDLTDANISGRRFLERLRELAPQIEILPPRGDPMARLRETFADLGQEPAKGGLGPASA